MDPDDHARMLELMRRVEQLLQEVATLRALAVATNQKLQAARGQS